MRIVIDLDLDAANDPDAHGWLDRILYRVEDGWHVWDLSELPDPDVFRNTPWIGSRGVQGERVCKLLVASIQRDAWAPAPHHGRRARVTPHPAGPAELKPEPAFRLADEPLVILVENRDSDGAFVECVVRELDRSFHALWKRDGKTDPIRQRRRCRPDAARSRETSKRSTLSPAARRHHRQRPEGSGRPGKRSRPAAPRGLPPARSSLLGARQAGSRELSAPSPPRRYAPRQRPAQKAGRSMGQAQ